MNGVSRLETRVERAWASYVAAVKRAQQTLDISDGAAAGRAWAAFIREFEAKENARDDNRKGAG